MNSLTVWEARYPIPKGMNPYQYHQIAGRGFKPYGKGDVPFRLAVDEGQIVVRSETQPMYNARDGWDVRQVALPVEGSVKVKIRLDTHRRINRGSKRVEVPLAIDEIPKWFTGMLDQMGLSAEDVRGRPLQEPLPVKGGAVIPVAGFEFECEAQVINPSDWRRALVRGVGRKKIVAALGMPLVLDPK
jgi:hypothetical protein